MNWKMDILKDVLPVELVNKLYAFPVPEHHMGPDTSFWAWERSGKFTVSSAYRFLREGLDAPPMSYWNLVWKLDVPERVRSFVWQVMHGKLATKVYCSRWSDASPNCHYCVGIPESIQHVLRDCPIAMSVWQHLVTLAKRANFFGLAFVDWGHFNLVSAEDSVWRSTWATTCFFLWKWQNLEVHDDNFVRPSSPMRVIRHYVQNYFASKEKFNPLSTGPRTLINACWKAAPSGVVTMNTDGASKEGKSGCGGVIRGTDGSWLGGFMRYLGNASPYVAELWGAIEGLKLARSMGFLNVELQMDSKVVVSLIASGADGNIDGRGLLTGIRRLLQLD